MCHCASSRCKDHCPHAIRPFETIWLRVLDHPRFPEADLSARLEDHPRTRALPKVCASSRRACRRPSSWPTTPPTHPRATSLSPSPSDPLEVLGNQRRPPVGQAQRGEDRRLWPPARTCRRVRSARSCSAGRLALRGRLPGSGAHGQESERGWFHTGDLGGVDRRPIAYSGRLKDMLKVGGENVAAAEVEDYLRPTRG